MKKIAIGMPVFGLMLAIAASAFKTPETAPKPKQDPALYWFTPAGFYTLRQNTHTNEVTPSGCPDQGSVICEKGYLQDDLVDPAHPELGVKSGATPDDFIMRTQ